MNIDQFRRPENFTAPKPDYYKKIAGIADRDKGISTPSTFRQLVCDIDYPNDGPGDTVRISVSRTPNCTIGFDLSRSVSETEEIWPMKFNLYISREGVASIRTEKGDQSVNIKTVDEVLDWYESGRDSQRYIDRFSKFNYRIPTELTDTPAQLGEDIYRFNTK